MSKDSPRAPRSGAANPSIQTNIVHHIRFQIVPKNENILLEMFVFHDTPAVFEYN
jgi:hypothetical protein